MDCTIDRPMKLFILFSFGGGLYTIVELLFRQSSHWSMFILGGICFLLVGGINSVFTDMPLAAQMGISAVIITVLEFLCGCVVNLLLGWQVWNYEALPLNLFGQVCLYFSLAWYFLSFVGIVTDDFLRTKLFYEPAKKYTLIRRKPAQTEDKQ